MLKPTKDSGSAVYPLPKRAPYSDTELLERVMALGKQTYFVFDAETNELQWPEATYRLWGLDPQISHPMTIDWVISTIHQDDREAVKKQFFADDWDDQTSEYRIILSTGEERHIRNLAQRERRPDGSTSRVFGLLQDISDERRISGELTTNRAFLDLAIRSADLAIWQIDLDTDEVTGNDQVSRLLGYEPGELELVNSIWSERCHPDDVAGRADAFDRHINGETDQYEHEYRLRTKSGDWIWVLVNGQIVERHSDGRPRRMAGTTLDITARKSAEQDLGAENELLSLALRMGRLGYFYRDDKTSALFWAPETFQIWGVEAVAGGPSPEWILSTVHPDDRDHVVARTQDPSWADMEQDFRIIRPDGQVRYIRGQTVRQKDAAGNVISSYGIYQDISHFRNMQNALLESEARFRSIFETSGSGIAISDDRGEIRYINQAFADLLGTSVQDLIGQKFTALSPDGEGDPVIAHADDMRDGVQKQLNIEKRYRHRDGYPVWVRLNITVADGLGVGECMFIGVAQDITERKEAEQRLTESRQLLEEAQRLGNIGHWTWVPETDEAEWSSQMYRILGLDPNQPELQVTSFQDYVHPDDRGRVDDAIAHVVEHGTSLALEYRLIQADGKVRNVIGRAERENLPSGTYRLIGTVQDLTDRKRNEAVLQKAIDTAESANRAKSKFLANMSHELRTPLNAILGFAQLLSLKTRGPLNDDQRSYVDNIVHGGEHLLGLINDVLDLARIDTGQLAINITVVDAVDVVDQVLKNFQQLAETRNVTIAFSANAPARFDVLADQMRLTQVMVNLVSNAIKYNVAGASVEIKLSDIEDGFGRIAVADTGQGIAAERQQHVFESFNRLGAESSGEEGTGIGLALSKSLTEQMNGSIDFESSATGTEFWISLPKSN